MYDLSIAQIERPQGHGLVCCSRSELEHALTDRIRKSVQRQPPGQLWDRVHDRLGK
jgi:hypothetical protein